MAEDTALAIMGFMETGKTEFVRVMTDGSVTINADADQIVQGLIDSTDPKERGIGWTAKYVIAGYRAAQN